MKIKFEDDIGRKKIQNKKSIIKKMRKFNETKKKNNKEWYQQQL